MAAGSARGRGSRRLGRCWRRTRSADCLDLFIRAGGQLLENVSVSSIQQPAAGGVRLVTADHTYEADAAVVTAGPWAADMVQRAWCGYRSASRS